MDLLLEKAKRIFDVWLARDLGLIGKILVINALIMSLFVYRLTVLPALSKDYIYKINQIWSHFLWNNKKPKIAWKIVTAPKTMGGLGLSDIHKRDLSLKTQWVSIYFKDETIRFLADWSLSNKIGEFLWHCNIHPKDCRFLTPNRGFWYDVLKAWCKFNYVPIIGVDKIKDQVLWFNSDVKKNGKIFIDMYMFNNGIRTVSDIMNQDDELLTTKQFSNKYPNINILNYLALVKAISLDWKRALNWGTLSSENFKPKVQIAQTEASVVRIAYQSFHTNYYLLQDKMNKWEQMLSTEVWPQDFIKVLRNMWAITNFSKL